MSSAALTSATSADLDVGCLFSRGVDLPVLVGISRLGCVLRRGSAVGSSKYVYVGGLDERQSSAFLARKLDGSRGVC